MNKHQKALDRMDKNCDNYIENCNSVYTFSALLEDNLTLQELVDKATPIKPLEEHGYTKCPICFRIVSEQYNTYCGDCSQAIDWEEE